MIDDDVVKLQDLELFCRKGIGPITYKKYLEYKDLNEVRSDFTNKCPLDKALYDSVISQGCEFVTYRSNNYPQLLREMADSPIILFSKGNSELLWNPLKIGISGTRSPTDYGNSVCQDLVKSSPGDAVFVTGLALGIDTIIAEECLKLGIKVIGVLPANIRNVVPRSNSRLVDKILGKDGLIIWENPLTEISNGSFIQRNRIIAGLSNFLIIIEADLKSGSITTADFAFDYNRDVYALPGKIYSSKSKGTNNLIKENKAKILTSFSDLPGFGVENSEFKVDLSKVDKLEQKLYYAILDEPKGLDDLLSVCSEYPILLSKLLNLEILGYIKKAHDGKYMIA